jgi:GcrA cell cycle regulator
MTGYPWLPEHDEEIKAAWLNGDSAGIIAKHYPGRSRNAVIGRLHRLGVIPSGRRAPSQPGQKVGYVRMRGVPKVRMNRPALIFGPGYSPEPKPRYTPQLPPSLQALNDASLRVSLLDLTHHHCRYITHGEGADSLFCGHRKREGSGYCEGHASATSNGVPKATKPPYEATRRAA